MAQGAGFPDKNDKDGLCDFLSVMDIAYLAQGNRVNQIDVSLHQHGERFVRMIFNILAQQ